MTRAKLPSSLTRITDQYDNTVDGCNGNNNLISKSIINGGCGVNNTIASPAEAECIISSIKHFPIQEIGSSSFLKMYGFQIEKLSLQAHLSASTNTCTTSSLTLGSSSPFLNGADSCGEDEYVIDLLLTHDKISSLVQTLLAIEAWRVFILGGSSSEKREHKSKNAQGEEGWAKENGKYRSKMSFMKQIAKQGNLLRTAFILHAETTIVSLLTLLFYRKDHVLEIDNAILLSIVDYCARQMSSLAAPLSDNQMVYHQKHPRTVEQIKFKASQQQQNSNNSNGDHNDVIDEIIHNLLNTEYQTAVKATSVARYLCEHFDSLSISIQSRIINTHDFLMLFIPLIDEPPWTRRRDGVRRGAVDESKVESKMEGDTTTVWEKYIDQEWKEIQPCDLLQITQCEAQCWIAVFHLTCSSANCREQYGLNTYRKEQILRLRKFLNEYLMDQLPVLSDVRRYMDELSLMHVPDHNSGGSSNGVGMTVLMEQIDSVRESLLNECNGRWDEVARNQFELIFSRVTDATDADLRLIATVYDEESINFENSHDRVFKSGSLDPFLMPLEIISISMSKDNGEEMMRKEEFVDMFHLSPSSHEDESTTTVQTPNGLFQRKKLAIKQVGDFKDLLSLSKDGLKMQANISFKNIAGVKQFNIDLMLPNAVDSNKKIEWVQLGKLEDQLVLQMGFEIGNDESNHELYNLVQAYVAQPAEEGLI